VFKIRDGVNGTNVGDTAAGGVGVGVGGGVGVGVGGVESN
jgi:hypothetical protein